MADSVRFEQTVCALCGSGQHVPVASGSDYEYQTCDATCTFVRCADCQHVYLNPRPAIESAHLIYPQNYYTMEERPPRGAARLLSKLKERILVRRVRGLVDVLPKAARVLEIGCGDGQLLKALRKHRPDLDLVGVDLKFSQHHLRQLRDLNIHLYEGPFEQIEIAAGFDLVIMNQLVEHLWDVRACLTKVVGMMNPGGRISLATPNLDGYDRVWFSKSAWGGYYFPRHLNVFSRSSLARLLNQHGFDVVSHHNLVAPLIWKGTFLGVVKSTSKWPRRFITERNLPLLAFFTGLDLIAKAMGCSTSNQQIIAQKTQRSLSSRAA